VTASLLGLSLLAAVLVPSGSARAPSVAKGRGTLRVAIYMDPGTIEPATTLGDQSVQLMYATQLSLVANREDGDPGTGRQIIPYGAQLPTLSDDGRTYTFRIRSGLQFSDGSPVTARSFKAGFERVLDPRLGGLWGWQFANVVGARAFMQGRAADVSGVRATKDRLVFHLAEAEPDFLSRLAVPWLVSAMPLGMPREPGGIDAPLQSAGPYYVQEYVPRRTLRLRRNPYWKSSTLPSRPANFQKIDYLERVTAEDAVTAVSNGDADVATVLDPTALTPDRIQALVRRYGVNGRQFWVRPETRRYTLVFNTRHQPFDEARLRRAASFALDRKQLLQETGPLAGRRVTDQLLHPVSAGFRDWRLYPSRPDLKRANRNARGALRGEKATLIVDSTVSGQAVGNEIKSNLAPLGLRVEVVPKAPSVLREWLINHPEEWDLATVHAKPGRVDPIVFINFGLEGDRYDSVPAACPCFYNYSGFNDPKWVRRMRRTDNLRHGRLKAYAKLDRALMQGPVPVAPYATGNSLTLVSPRIGCFKSSPYPAYLAPNLAALCPR
jgi:peptide/nickel transport system substrate-binding protein